MISCKHCGCSGSYIGYTGYKYNISTSTSEVYSSPIAIVPCKYCKGIGYIDEEELITVPRKFIKDEYFEQL